MLNRTRVQLPEAFWFQEGPGVRNTQFRDCGIKLLNVANITKSGNIDLQKTDRHLETAEALGKYKHFLADAGDLVIASSGISIDADNLLRTRGAFVEEHHLPLCMNTSTIRFKAVEKTSDLRYLKHWLQSDDFRSQITRLVTGSAQKNFGPSHLKKLWINLPPLPEQRRIAAILDQADALRAKRREALAKLDEMAQAIFVEMFVSNADEVGAWPQVSVGSLALSMRTGPFGSQLLHSEFVDEGVAVLGIDNAVSNQFTWDERRFITEQKYQQLSRFRVFPRDVIITIMGTCGRSAIVPNDIPLAITTKHLCSITLDQSICLSEYLHACLLRHPGVLKQLGVAARGAVMPGLNMGVIKSAMIPLPPLRIQQKFDERIKVLADLAMQHQKSTDHLEVCFSSLQHRAFRGEL